MSVTEYMANRGVKCRKCNKLFSLENSSINYNTGGLYTYCDLCRSNIKNKVKHTIKTFVDEKG